MNIRCFLTRLRVKKIPVLNPARSLKNQLPHPLAPKDKAFPLPHPPPPTTSSPQKKKTAPKTSLVILTQNHPTRAIPGRSPAHISQSTKRACTQRISSSFFKKFFKPLLLRLPFLRSHPIHSFIKPLQGLLLSLGHSLRNLNH